VSLGRLHGDEFPSAFIERLKSATDFLYRMVDPETGRVPNYGPNDGASILPLSSCDYGDFRPILQASRFLLHGDRLFEQGPWDELSLWMLGAASLPGIRATVENESRSFEKGGYYTMRGGHSWGMIRCHSYVERPAQADMLHLDLWWRGHNVLRDTGTYSYNCDAPWQDYFKSTAAHNTIEVRGQSQMCKGPRFMWFDWTKSRFIGRGSLDDEAGEWWEGEHYGYRKRFGVTHRRRIERRGADRWTVLDSLTGNRAVTATLRWHLIDGEYDFDASTRTLTMQLTDGTMRLSVTAKDGAIADARVLRGAADGDTAEGWESLYYGEKQPIPVLRIDVAGPMPITVETDICFSGTGKTQ